MTDLFGLDIPEMPVRQRWSFGLQALVSVLGHVAVAVVVVAVAGRFGPTAPSTTMALFRHSDHWAVYVMEGGRAQRTAVQLGHQTGQDTEVVSGLGEHAHVILHPGDTLVDGARVRERRAAD